jgi:hypothetical protein
MDKFMGRDNDPSVGSAERVRTARAGCSGETEATGPSVVSRPSLTAMSDSEIVAAVKAAVYWCQKHGRLHYRDTYLGPENLEWIRRNCPQDVCPPASGGSEHE